MESQIEASRSEKTSSVKQPPDAEEADLRRKKETLRLARVHLLVQIQSSSNPRHREMMERALADLDKLLASYH